MPVNMQAAASYPRAGGVVVPSCLVRAGLAGAEVVAWLRRSHRRLPADLLTLELADPATILRSWVIGQRTRGSLERLLGCPDGASARTVGDYLAAPWLGMHGLVDLLAAREEQELAAPKRAEAPIPPPAPAPPVGVLRRGGAAVVMARDELASAEALVNGATQFVFHWGMCSLNALVSRIHVLTGQPLSVATAERILTTMPRFRWLDQGSGWFSFAGSGSRLRQSLDKIFALTERVLLRDLRVALAKQIELLATVPIDALETYLAAVAGCDVADGWVCAPRSNETVPLGGDEGAIVAMLESKGGELATRSLREQARRRGLRAPAVLRLLRTSPLVLERAGRLRLVGSPRQRRSAQALPAAPRPRPLSMA